jgi:hypothetical protein
MSSVIISGDTSGAVTVAAPAVSGTNTLTLQAATATNAVNTLGTAVASTSGTSIDFTSLPSWIKRITVLYNGVSTSGTSNWLIQIGSGSIITSGYASGAHTTANSDVLSTAGYIITPVAAAAIYYGAARIELFGSNAYICSGVISPSTAGHSGSLFGGVLTLSGALDRVRLTTVNGTDTFDLGSVNILYEG